MRNEGALIVMGKAPVPGTVKTRLAAALSPAEAAKFYASMLEDTVREMEKLKGTARYLFFWPAGEEGYFRSERYRGFMLRPQHGRNLGERIAAAAGVAFRDGARRVAVIGGDCPALSAARVVAAFAELSGPAEAVFGPSLDGGFYLAGISRPRSDIFRGIPWGGPAVLSEVSRRCRASGTAYALLPAESDVDTPEDIEALRNWALAHRSPRCPLTRQWLISFGGSPAAGSDPAPSRGRRPPPAGKPP